MAKKDPSLDWDLETEITGNRQRTWQGKRKSKRRTAARKAGAPRMSLTQMERQMERLHPYPGYGKGQIRPTYVEGGLQGYQAEASAMRQEMGMGKKLMKGGGGIRLPQMPKGGMKALLPLLLLTMLMGGTGGGNEDLDGMLG